MDDVKVVSRSQVPSEDRDMNVLDVIIVLAKHKLKIIRLTLLVTVLAIIISLLLPNVYSSSVKLLPPQQSQSSAAALLSQLGGAAGLAAGVAGLKNPSDLYIGMLKSRTISDKLIERFNLRQIYDLELYEKTRRKLEENTTITAAKDGLITIEVEDKDKKRAAQLANAYVEELIRLTKTLAVTEASQRRLFFERQLEQAKDNLANSEIALRKGLSSRGVASVDVESRAALETVARVRAQISAKEVQLNSMRSFVTESNPSYLRVAEELASLRSELTRLENGKRSVSSEPDDSRTPEGLENIKLLRDVKYYQMLYELLAKQYEVARLDEAKDPSIIQVLDTAVEAEQKAKPHRSMIVVLSAVIAFVIAVLLAFVREAKYRALMLPENSQKWTLFKSYISVKHRHQS